MTPPKRRWLRWSIVAFACGLGYFAFLIYPPNVSARLTPSTGGALQLDLRKNFKVNYLSGAWLCVDGDDKTPLWQIRFTPGKTSRANIRLHTGEPNDEGRLARAIRAGEHFFVVVDCQYDSAIPPAACTYAERFHFKLAPDGTPEYLGVGW